MLRVELCAGEFPVPVNEIEINDFSISNGMSNEMVTNHFFLIEWWENQN